MKNIIFTTLLLALTSASYAEDLPKGFCGSNIQTTEGKIELLPIRITTAPDSKSGGERECKSFILGSLSRLCLSSVFKASSKIDIGVYRQVPFGVVQGFMSAQCKKSILGKWSFIPDVSSGGYYMNRGYEVSNFIKKTLYSELKEK